MRLFEMRKFRDKKTHYNKIELCLKNVETCYSLEVDQGDTFTPRQEYYELHSVEIAVDKAYVRFVGDVAYVDIKKIMSKSDLENMESEAWEEYNAGNR